MIVCNHIGYIEIVYLVGKRAPSFVAKKAVSGAPVIGTITSVCGALMSDWSRTTILKDH